MSCWSSPLVWCFLLGRRKTKGSISLLRCASRVRGERPPGWPPQLQRMSFRLVGYRLLCRLNKRESLPALDTTCSVHSSMMSLVPASYNFSAGFQTLFKFVVISFSYTTDSDFEECFDKFWSARKGSTPQYSSSRRPVINELSQDETPPSSAYIPAAVAHEAGNHIIGPCSLDYGKKTLPIEVRPKLSGADRGLHVLAAD